MLPNRGIFSLSDVGNGKMARMSESSPDASPTPAPLGATQVVRTSVITAVVLLAVYVWRAAPTTYMLDSAELVATTFSLGVSHPPGHPAFHLLAYGPMSLPFGTAAFGVHVASALFSALALALLPLACWRLGWVRHRSQLAFAALVAVGIGFTPAFAQQSIRAEVYSLHALTVALATLAVVRPARDTGEGHALLAAVALGVGLLNHHYLVVFAFPAFAWAVLSGGARPVRRTLVGALAGASLLAGYLALPMRAAQRPQASWGWPDSLGDLWWTISAQAFQKTAGRAATMDPVAGAINVIGVLGESLTLPGLLLAAGGVIALALRQRRIAAFLGLGIAFNLATQLLFDFDPMNPDALGYFMPTYWWLGMGLVFLVNAIELPGNLTSWTHGARTGLGLLLVLGIAVSARFGPRTVALGDYWDSEYFRDEALNGLPPESAWITAYFETGFNTWYAQAVEDRRPDVTHVHQAFLTYPFYREMLEARGDAAVELVGDEPDELLNLAALEARAGEAAVRIEPEQLVPVDVARRCVPTRLSLQLLEAPLPDGRFPPSLARESAANARAVGARFPEPLEVQTGRNLLWAHYNLAGQMCAADRLVTCRALLGEALRLAPEDPDLRAFAAEVDRRLAR